MRYLALDRCFSNFGRKYFVEDLIVACNDAIFEFAGISDGIKRRQVFDDITFMESDQGWAIPLERIKEGRRVYYRYSDKSFSITNQGINQSEAKQLSETLSILSRFKGMPQFDWIDEIQIRLVDTFKLSDHSKSVVAFEQNPFLKGLSHFSDLFNAIKNQKALEIEYQGFKQDSPVELVFHPWFLKEFNDRWFLFGLNDGYNSISNLAIDRIKSIKESKKTYIENLDIDFDDYFFDVIGVTVKENAKVEKIKIIVSDEVWPYIESKPLHGSQRIKRKTQSGVEIELTVQINHELNALLFSYMDAIEVLEPEPLRVLFKKRSEIIYNKYL